MTQPKLPNFFLAGAGESGTTSLCRYLGQHPQVYLSPIKEPNYFAAADILTLPNFRPMAEREFASLLAQRQAGKAPDKPVAVTEWSQYLRLFAAAGDATAIGEGSAMYLWFPSAAPAIHRAVPDAKLIFILRDPAERLHTLYLRTLRAGQPAAFRSWILQAMQKRPDRRLRMQRHPLPLDCGLYGTHLSRYFDLFPREQIRVHRYEDYRADPAGVLRDLFGFLGVDPSHPVDFSLRHNETLVPRYPVLHQWRRRLIGDVPLATCLPAPLRTRVLGWYNRRRPELPLAPEDRQLVVDYYRDEIRRAQDLIGRDLSAWLR